MNIYRRYCNPFLAGCIFAIIYLTSANHCYCQWQSDNGWTEDSSQAADGKPKPLKGITITFDDLDEESLNSVAHIYANVEGRASAILIDQFELSGNTFVDIPVYENEQGAKYIKTSIGNKTLDQIRSLRVQVKGQPGTKGKSSEDYPTQRIEFKKNQLEYFLKIDGIEMH